MTMIRLLILRRQAFLNGKQIGVANFDGNQSIDLPLPTQEDKMQAYELADTRVSKFGVISFSYMFHQIVSILLCFMLKSLIEPKSKFRSYDVYHQGVYFEIASGYHRLDEMPMQDRVVVIDKYLLAEALGVKTHFSNLSRREERRHLDYENLCSPDPRLGIFSQPKYLSNKPFLESCAPLYQEMLSRKLKEKVNTVDFKSFEPEPISKTQKFSSYITRIPWNHIIKRMSEDPTKRTKSNLKTTNGIKIAWGDSSDSDVEYKIPYLLPHDVGRIMRQNLPWIKESDDEYQTFDQKSMKHEFSVFCESGVWTLRDKETEELEKQKDLRYELSSESQYKIISTQYIEDIKEYAKTHDKKWEDICARNYGRNWTEVRDPKIVEYDRKHLMDELFFENPQRYDEEQCALLLKCMPHMTRVKIAEAYTNLADLTTFQESLFLRQISESIILHKRNTHTKRLVIKHPVFNLCAAVSILGDIASNNSDAGFASVRFYYQLNSCNERMIPGFACLRNPVAGSVYTHMSQTFKFRKPDISWFLAAPEKMIMMHYSSLEELGSDASMDMKERCLSLTNLSCSIVNRSSWGYSRVLKPFKYYVINVSQKSNFCKIAEDKVFSEMKKYGGISKFPELSQLMLMLNKNLDSNEGLTPCFQLPMPMIGNEAHIMNLCPKLLYARSRHTVQVFKNIAEETDLYYDNLKSIIKIRDHAEYVYQSWIWNKEKDYQLLLDHYKILEEESKLTDGRFIYSPLSQCLILQECQALHDNLSDFAGSIHGPKFSELLSTKGAFSTHTDKNCKAIEGFTHLAKEMEGKCPLTTMNICAIMADEMIEKGPPPLLYAIVPKDQVGGDREISMMNEKFRIFQSLTESVSKHYSAMTGVDKLADSNKDSTFYKLATIDEPTFAFIGDQTRWGPNFNTAVFGDMFQMLYLAGFPCTYIPQMVCYMSQRKIFLTPQDVDIDRITDKMRSTNPKYSGVHAPSHMGEGIFHYTSSLFHSLTLLSFVRILKSDADLSPSSIHPLCTSDDVTIIHKSIEKTDIPTLVNYYQGFQKFLLPFSIKTSTYKNLDSTDYVEFNSMAVFSKSQTYMYQTLKQTIGNIIIPVTHTFWNDLMFSVSTFNTFVNSGSSFTTAYMAYLLNTTLAYRRWSMLRLFYKEGFFRVLTLKQLIQNDPLFPREYSLEKDEDEIRVVKSADSVSVFKFKTYEKLQSCWTTFKDLSMYLNLHSESRMHTLKYSPASNQTPLSRYILPSGFKNRATVPLNTVPSAFAELKHEATPTAPITIELAAVISSQSWFWKHDSKPELDFKNLYNPEGMSSEDYLSNILTYLTMSLRTDSDLADISSWMKVGSLRPAVHKLRKRDLPPLDVESIMIENFGSYYPGYIGDIHMQIQQKEGMNYKLSTQLRKAIDDYFKNYQEIYTFISSLIQLLEDAMSKASMRVMGLYPDSKNCLYANYCRLDTVSKYIIKGIVTIPLSLLFEVPITDYAISSMKGIPITGSKIHIVNGKFEYTMMKVANVDSLTDCGSYYLKRRNLGDVIYKKPSKTGFIKLQELCGYCDLEDLPGLDQRVCVADTEMFHQEEVVIHAQEIEPSVMSVENIMNFMESDEFDPTKLKFMTMDETFDPTLNQMTSVTEIEEEDIRDAGLLGMFSKKNKSKMTIRKRVVELNDIEMKRAINACRDGYILKKSASYWLMDQDKRLFEKMTDPELGFGFFFHNPFLAQVFSDCKYGTKGQKIKCPNSLRVMVNQIFESPPMMKIRFTEDGETLFVSQTGLKLARLSLQMKRSPLEHVSSLHLLPLFILSLSYGR